MNKRKKIFSMALGVLMAFSIMCSNINLVNAENSNQNLSASIVENGTCGKNANWTLYSDGKLEISGTGDMDDYGPKTTETSFMFVPAPWDSQKENITSIVVDNGITHVGAYTFGGCENVISLNISNSVTSLGQCSFDNLLKIEKISIPDSVTTIDAKAFSYCENLKSITLSNNLSKISSDMFTGCYSLETITIPESVTALSFHSFCDCTSLKKVVLPKGLTDLGEWTFYECHNLEEINIPDGVTQINSGVFENCYKLKSITVPKSVTAIDNGYENVEPFNKDYITLKVYDGSFGLNYAKENGFKYEVIAEDISFKKNAVSLNKNQTYQLQPVLSPSGSIASDIKWTTSNKNIVDVKDDGTISAMSKGTATITATLSNGNVATCTVTVYDSSISIVTPSIDTSKEVEKAIIGINDSVSNTILKENTDDIIKNVLLDNNISSISEKTASKIKEAIKAGKSITTLVETKVVDEKDISKDNQSKIKDAIKELEKKNTVNIYQYLDLSILLQANNETLGEITQLNQPIKFTIKLPTDLIKDNRKFYIVRIHEGKTDILDTTLNKDNTLTFETDKFSTYALVYADEKPISQTNQKTTNSVKTGDNSLLNSYMLLCIISLSTILFIYKKKIS